MSHFSSFLHAAIGLNLDPRGTTLKDTEMTPNIEPVRADQPDFAGRVTGLDIAQGISADEAAEIEAGMDHYGVLVLGDQVIDDDQQFAFSRHFGPMELATGDAARAGERRLPKEINDISNLDQQGHILARDDRRRLFNLGNQLWHSDSSYKPTPAKYSLLSAHTIPGTGGNTELADMRAAWDALDANTKNECQDLVCEHSLMTSRGLLGFTDFSEEEQRNWAPVPQRLVRRHPSTGRLSLFLASHIGTIRGWPTPEARVFLNDLTEHATQRRLVYAHEWRQWDLVIWDNRVVMHRARRFNETVVRDMRRTTVADSAPTLEQPL